MGSVTLERLQFEAMALPESERAELAHRLVLSLDGTADADAEQAWSSEIARRLADIDAGVAKLVDRDELRRRLQAGFSHI